MIAIPDELTTTMARFGDKGRAWLRSLPPIVDEFVDRWSLTLGSPFPASYSYVTPARLRDGVSAVLKVNFVDRENVHEGEALRRYEGRGAVRLLDADDEAGVLLLERCEPGTRLSQIEDDEVATAIAADVIRRLWKPVGAGHPFERVSDRARAWAASVPEEFERLGRPFDTDLAERASALFAELADSSDEAFLLDQDFHHYNVLAAQREPWLAIDPKPLVGDRAFDLGALLRNPGPQVFEGRDPGRVTARRIDQLVEALGLSRERIVGWAVAQSVELGLWSLSVGDRETGEWEIFCAEVLSQILG